MKGPQALMAAVAALVASCVRAGNHRNKWVFRIEAEEMRTEVFLKIILPATIASDSANRARAMLASSSAARRVA